MHIDCPNCSIIFKTDFIVGEKVTCPFCDTRFSIFQYPFEQLEQFLKIKNPPNDKSCFFNQLYVTPASFKNYVGWVKNRIKNNQFEELHKFCSNFISKIEAAMLINNIFSFDFRKYIIAEDDFFIELSAIWLVSALNSRYDNDFFYTGIVEHLWSYSFEIKKEFQNLCLENIKNTFEDIEDCDIENLFCQPLNDNPLLNWSQSATPALRQRLILILNTFTHYADLYQHPIELDNCSWYQSRVFGIDYEYATQILIDSNIFICPEPEDIPKFFKKKELMRILDTLGMTYKPRDLHDTMFSKLLASVDGKNKLKEIIKEANVMCLHPSLNKYADDLLMYYKKYSLLWQGILLFNYNSNFKIKDFLSVNKSISHAIKKYIDGLNVENIFPAWKYHCCQQHDIDIIKKLDGKVFLKSDPIWRYIFPPNNVNCTCYTEDVRNENVDSNFDFNLIKDFDEIDFNPKILVDKLFN